MCTALAVCSLMLLLLLAAAAAETCAGRCQRRYRSAPPLNWAELIGTVVLSYGDILRPVGLAFLVKCS